jgi:protein SCO1/2
VTPLGRVAAALLAALGLACDRPTLPTLGTVPAFSLIERSGRTFTQEDVRGRVWIANFIFTRCPDVCPVLTTRMAGVQASLRDAASPVVPVSISVDPVHDTPPTLQAYAAAHAAGPEWAFLTGDRDAIKQLLTQGFQVAFGDDGPAEGPLTHSNRFVLVDGRLRIRGYYHGTEPDDLERLVADARRLARDPAG